MKVSKKILGNLEKCYSIAQLQYKNQPHFLIAAEKHDKCILFDKEGNQVDVIWEEPGGVMTMQQIPGSDGQFLATHKFYSPNDSADAKIVIADPTENGWNIRTLTDLPFVHRFDILHRNGINYLIACCLKSGHEFKGDWNHPGKVFAAILPEDLSSYNDEHQLKLEPIKEGLTKNHGYCRIENDGYTSGLISAEEGIFTFVPPEEPAGSWTITQLTDEPASDAVLVDFDCDGQLELAAISPFHGEKIFFYRNINGKYEKEYTYGKDLPFAHAIFGGKVQDKPVLIIGHREGDRDLLLFSWDSREKTYTAEVLDHDIGPANIMHCRFDNKEVLISTNREIDEMAMYTFEK